MKRDNDNNYINTLGVIQIIRDTLGEGVNEMYHKLFLLFKMPLFILLGVKFYVVEQNNAS